MSDYSRDDFARAVLTRLGAPISASNVEFFAAWMAREGTSAAFNPLATTLDYGSNTKFNSVGVRNYADFATGVEATARTLTGGYSHIVADLVRGDGAAAAHEGAELSKWSGGGYTSLTIGFGGGGISLPDAGDVVGAVAGAITDPFSFANDFFGDQIDGWVKTLIEGLLTLTFAAFGMVLISMGLHRLTGHSPVELFTKGAGAAQTAATVAAIA